ncbi:hypothetical protein Pchl3084_4772 [Pseudomonas chlororaphis subsp. aureofaciens 30-84]|nr:hypothetical protein Pchl3084_4772 [Pseudomonas chlororaphis subsp. aureofaciens 30-84]
MPEQFMPHPKNPQATPVVALSKNGRYSLAVAAKSATGFDGPSTYRRTGAPISIAGAFFVPAFSFHGGCAWETFGSAGVLYARSVNLRTAATLIRLTANRGSSSHTGVTPDETRPQSVQISRRCTPCNGSRRSTRQLQPRYSPCPLQRPYGQSSRSRSRRRCPMNSSLSFALPEDLLCVSKDIEKGVPVDAITCAINRAESVLMLLEDHFESEGDRPRLANHVLAAVIWDVRGTLGLIKTLTLHGDTTSVPMDQQGGAV